LQAAKSSLAALALLALVACSQPANNAAGAADDAAASSEREYQAAPELTGASPVRDGRIELVGRAAPGAAVRLTSPGAPAQFATADAAGLWRVTIPASAQPRLFGLSMSTGGRVVQALGYLFVAPGAIARLRVGGGAEVLAAGERSLTALALDYDAKGAATLSGFAAPGETVELRADGVERGQAVADQAGRFVLSLAQPLTAGAHDFELVAPSGAARFSAAIGPASPVSGAPYAARREGAAWRVDWISPGGGEQTTLIFDAGAGGGTA
jgi:hypothetical protein